MKSIRPKAAKRLVYAQELDNGTAVIDFANGYVMTRPDVNEDGELVTVIEIYKSADTPSAIDDYEIISTFTVWGE
jgi:hypothetical protein